MKVILIKDVAKIGKKGEVKEVNDGFANNFLIAKGFGKIATKEIQAKLEKEAKEATAKADRQNEKMNELKRELEKRTFTVAVKVGDKGQIFGGAHEKDIIAAINAKLNTTLEKQNVHIEHPIKSIGQHKVKIKLGHGQEAITTINIEPK